MDRVITSKNNPYVKAARALAAVKNRRRQRLFLLEGPRLIAEALQAGIMMDFALAAAGKRECWTELENRLQEECPLFQVEDHILGLVTDLVNPPGIVVVAHLPSDRWDDVFLVRDKPILVVDAVQDPGNVGTMIRTAEAAGAAGVLLTRETVDLYNQKVIRATMGSIFRLPVIMDMDADQVIAELAKEDIPVIVADSAGNTSLAEASLAGRIALVVGNENRGPSPVFVARASQVVRIPLLGCAESLNVAVAAGVLLYEALRQSRDRSC